MKIYYYINIMNFGFSDQRVMLQESLYELPKNQLNKILNDYKVIIQIDEDLFNELYKLLYERED